MVASGSPGLGSPCRGQSLAERPAARTLGPEATPPAEA